MTTYDKLLNEAKEIQEYLEITCSDNPEEVVERIKTINVYQARTGYMLAEAKKMYRQKRSSEISRIVVDIAQQNFLCASAQKALVESIAEDEAYLVDWTDRLNSACSHQQDALRSILSYAKEQMKNLNYSA